MGPAALAVLTAVASFGDYLYERGDYVPASVEYQRLLYETADTLGNPLVALRLARCWQASGYPGRALGMYAFLGSNLPPGEARGSALMGAGSAYEQLGMPDRARESYLSSAEEFTDQETREECLVLAALCTGRSGRWDSAAVELGVISEASPGSPASCLRSIALRAADPPRRSALLCGAASAVLPGAGQAICGHWMDAASSLLMTAGAGALFMASLEDGCEADQAFFGWLALTFYGGGIWGGARAARRWDAEAMEEILDDVPGALSAYRSGGFIPAPLPPD
jgi:hypothetical protein